MKYYCKNCGSGLIIGEGIDTSDLFEDGMQCPFDLTHGEMELIPDYETPAQYEKRTGKAIADCTAVWVRCLSLTEDAYCWSPFQWGLARKTFEKSPIVIADPAVPPPDDFVPEN